MFPDENPLLKDKWAIYQPGYVFFFNKGSLLPTKVIGLHEHDSSNDKPKFNSI